jgi:hypothetical protein
MQRAFDLDDWKSKGPFYNDSRRTVRAMAVNRQPEFHEFEARRSHTTSEKPRSVPVLRCETRILMQR